MNKYILDASAILAFLQEESGGAQVADFLVGAIVSSVNLAEVVARLAQSGMPEPEIRETLLDLDLEVYPFDVKQALKSDLLRPRTQSSGLSLDDRSCLALGQISGLPILTADRKWSELDLGLDIVLVR